MSLKRGILLAALATYGFADDGPKIDYQPLSIAALHEFGQLRSGQYGQYDPFQNDWADHFGAFLTETATIGDQLVVDVGLGGLFEVWKKEEVRYDWGGSQMKLFFVGPTVADITYKTKVGGGSWSLGAGMFGYKYNPDASNLGEYLLRTGAYPTYILSGGYAYVNNAAVFGLEGLKSNFTRGGFSLDAFLLTETTLAPLYDLSLVGLAKYTTPGGLLNVFGGVNFKHLIPIHPSITTEKVAENSYFTKNGTAYSGNYHYYDEQATFWGRKYSTATNLTDSNYFAGQRDHYLAIADSLNPNPNNDTTIKNGLWLDPTTHVPAGAQYYTVAGTIVVAGGSLDFKKLFNAGIFGPNDLKLFSEVALLGVKDYPVFYQSMARRMPIMVGFNFPGFKIVDLISLQYEYFNSPWMNSYNSQVSNNYATPFFPSGSSTSYPLTTYNALANDDNIAWSVLVKKELVKGLSITGQAARDHIRAVSYQTWAGGGVQPGEILRTNSDWYWMVQFMVGI